MKAKLGGLTLRGDQEITWALSSGVTPFSTSWEDRAETIDQLIGLGQGPHKLELGDGQFDGVYVLEPQPGRAKFTKRVFLTDRRYLWAKKRLVGEYNMRRRTGTTFMIGERVEHAVFDPVIDYAINSLPGDQVGSPGGTVARVIWTAKTLLNHLLAQLGEKPVTFPNGTTELPIENMFIDHPGHQAISLVLTHLPGLELALGRMAQLYAYLTFDQSEQVVLQGKGLYKDFVSFPTKVLRHLVRPFKVRVLFTREQEFRVDNIAAANSLANRSGTSTERGRYDLTVDNVLPCPDPELTLVSGVQVGYGSWITITDALAAWDRLSSKPALAPMLDDLMCRKHFLTGFSKLKRIFTEVNLGDPVLEWDRRLSALANHYRQTFRLTSLWRDRLLAISPTRVGVVNRVTGTRAPSQVYAQYTVRPSYYGLTKKLLQRQDVGWCVEGWATNLADAHPGPFKLTILDPEAFVFHCEPRPDPWGEAEAVVMGTLDRREGNGWQMPLQDMGAFNRELEAFMALWEHAQLTEDWKMSVVLTGLMSSPNDTGRFHQVEVLPSQVANLVKNIGECNGPIIEVRIDPGLITAQFAWRDSDGQALRDRAFTTTKEAAAQANKLNELLVNKEHVENVALATAAELYEALLDRVETEASTFAFDQTVQPVGSMEQVAFTLDITGKLSTTVRLAAPAMPRSSHAFLPPGTKAIIYRTVAK